MRIRGNGEVLEYRAARYALWFRGVGLVRAAPGDSWICIEGSASARELVEEYRARASAGVAQLAD